MSKLVEGSRKKAKKKAKTEIRKKPIKVKLSTALLSGCASHRGVVCERRGVGSVAWVFGNIIKYSP